MITTEGLEGQLTSLRNASAESASATLQHWRETAKTALELASKATTEKQFDEAEMVLGYVRQAIAIVRGKVCA